MKRRAAICILLISSTSGIAAGERLRDSPDLRFWLENMIVDHGYSIEEAASGLETTPQDIEQLLKELGISRAGEKREVAGRKTKVRPWAPGRHPRIGFLEGAINPQRDTKISIFLPWDESAYVVLDLPEAVFSNLGLIYLAHTHVPTVWSEKGVELETIDWKRNADGILETSRRLPNNVSFGAKVWAVANGIEYEYWLENGTGEKLSGLRSQLCLMLKNAPGFNAQTGENKRLFDGAAAVRSEDGRRWIITACEKTGRTWQNPPVPCIHADPVFEDCEPGKRAMVKGAVWFYEGEDAASEIQRRKEKASSLPE